MNSNLEDEYDKLCESNHNSEDECNNLHDSHSNSASYTINSINIDSALVTKNVDRITVINENKQDSDDYQSHSPTTIASKLSDNDTTKDSPVLV
mmetsp:Transcript_1183/g.1232  ORF Transcript_1183/g.1232 Transcript_1183/m.1232 type:complete len:94 (+) Transcript_1183:108-389(+)